MSGRAPLDSQVEGQRSIERRGFKHRQCSLSVFALELLQLSRTAFGRRFGHRRVGGRARARGSRDLQHPRGGSGAIPRGIRAEEGESRKRSRALARVSRATSANGDEDSREGEGFSREAPLDPVLASGTR